MSKLIVSIIFGLFYYLYYLGILGFAWGTLEKAGIDLPEQIKLILYGISFLLFLVASYRAKIAADSYHSCNYKFWQTHKMAGIILKTNLSYLPIIGKFIGPKK